MSANSGDATPPTISTRGINVERGHPQRFTGDVVVEHLGEAEVKVLRVSFGEGARTAVHRHNSTQWLYFLEGRGFVEEIDGRNQGPARPRADEAVVTPKGVWHHHGALDGFHAVHLSITRAGLDDDPKNWRLGDFRPPVPPEAAESG
jgi:quercetin dioxygenase-like cupin family protein